AGRGPARGAERGAGGGGDHAPRLSERGGGARLLRGVSARLRSSWEGVPSLRHDDQEDRAGGEEHLFLPRLPEVASVSRALFRRFRQELQEGLAGGVRQRQPIAVAGPARGLLEPLEVPGLLVLGAPLARHAGRREGAEAQAGFVQIEVPPELVADGASGRLRALLIEP